VDEAVPNDAVTHRIGTDGTVADEIADEVSEALGEKDGTDTGEAMGKVSGATTGASDRIVDGMATATTPFFGRGCAG
jgi:hypothetical protein